MPDRTGLSDCILLKWEDIKKSSDGGWVLDITTKKTKTDAILPISEEVLALCGECGEGLVFKKLVPDSDCSSPQRLDRDS